MLPGQQEPSAEGSAVLGSSIPIAIDCIPGVAAGRWPTVNPVAGAFHLVAYTRVLPGLPAMISTSDAYANVVAETRHWLTQAVIGLNLCPFAKAVQVKDQIRFAVSDATDAEGVLTDLQDELALLAEADPEKIDTTLLIIPDALDDFLEFNDFEDLADRLLKRMRLVGELQVATFHPQFQFADTQPDDIENYTNRSPYPILHLLREDSIDRAVESFPDAAELYEKNIDTMQRLGLEGWKRLMSKPA